ncbi:MAG: TonB-dependent receptor [Saprospiraceae bacterium]
MRCNPHAILLEEITVQDQRRGAQTHCSVTCDHASQMTQSRNIGDLFREIPGFNVIKRGGYAMDPVFRAYKYEQLNVIYDGGVQTTHACPGRMDPATSHVDPDNVEKIELIKGSFTTRYGASMGATINIVTDGWQTDKEGWGGFVKAGYLTNGQSKLTQAQVQHNGKLDFLLGAGWKDFGSYKAGNGTTIPTAFTSYEYTARLGYDLSTNQRLQFNWRQGFSRDILHASLNMDSDSDDATVASLDYQWKNIAPRIHSLKAKVFINDIDHVMSNTRRPNFGAMEAVATVAATNLGGRIELTLTPSSKNLLYAGVDYRDLSRSGNRERKVKVNMMTGQPLPAPRFFTDPIWQQAWIRNTGLFVEGKRFINDKLTFQYGLRTDFVQAGSDAPAPGFVELYPEKTDGEQEVNIGATLGLNHQVSAALNWQLSAGRGVRTANMIERYIYHFTVGVDPYEYVGNPSLRPEVNNQVELSARLKQPRYEIGASVFYSYLQDYISGAIDTTLARLYAGTLPYSRRYVNVEKAMQAGVECDLTVEISPQWTARLGGSYTYAQNISWNEPLAEIPPMQAYAEIRYERKKWWMEVGERLAAAQNRISTQFGETSTDGFQVTDLRVGVEPVAGLQLGLAVLNVFDTHYREHLNRKYANQPEAGVLYEPGRNISLMAKYSF